MLELDIRRKYHINILATKFNGILDPLPSAEHTFKNPKTFLFLRKIQTYKNSFVFNEILT